jgi:hypothetical protein
LREPGIGFVTASDSCSVWRISSLGTAFMAFVLSAFTDEAAAHDPWAGLEP